MSNNKMPRKRINKHHTIIRRLSRLYGRRVEFVEELYNDLDQSISETKSILDFLPIRNPLN